MTATKKPKKKHADEVRRDWTALCRLMEKEGKPLAITKVPKELSYLVTEDYPLLMFSLAELRPPLELEDAAAPVRKHLKTIRLVSRWRYRLLAGKCEVPYQFATLGDGGGIWQGDKK